MMDCERYGANVFEVIDLINRDYPRGGIALPGFTAGTCLRKDFAFSEERSNAPGMLLAVSRVNESVPLFLVEGIRRRLGDLRERKIAVLGLAFKADTDDERDSLSHKLIRLLERELADVAVHDPVVATPTQGLQDAITGADAVVVATNHSAYSDRETLASIGRLATPDCLVVDPWNAFGAAQVFGYASELAALVRPWPADQPPRPRPGCAAGPRPDRPERSSRALLAAIAGSRQERATSPCLAGASSWASPISSTSSSTLTSMPLEMFSAPSARLSAAAIQASATSRT